jgi:hypothetical protein
MVHDDCGGQEDRNGKRVARDSETRGEYDEDNQSPLE